MRTNPKPKKLNIWVLQIDFGDIWGQPEGLFNVLVPHPDITYKFFLFQNEKWSDVTYVQKRLYEALVKDKSLARELATHLEDSGYIEILCEDELGFEGWYGVFCNSL